MVFNLHFFSLIKEYLRLMILEAEVWEFSLGIKPYAEGN